MTRAFLLAIVALCTTAAAQNVSDLDFYGSLTEARHLRSALANHLKQQAHARLAERRAMAENLTTQAGIDARRREVREGMLAAIGGLPERTPLDPRVTGTIERPHYRIEKIVFESRPGFHVTANLYVPKRGQPPYPAILFPLGHEPGGKSYPAWQQVLGSLATKGYICLTWDPAGQGERVQLWDPDFARAKLIQSTTEHTVQGIQALLTGQHFARYTIWDGIRALDYLLSRPEADKTRVGLTGNSGGGTHTAYLGALDDRFHVAAPSCYLTSWGHLLDSIGPQDAEQVFPNWIGAGFDHPDFVLAFAPKPYLMLSAIRDFFSIAGARQTYREASRAYDSLRAAERMAMVDADDGHGYSKPRRVAAYEWFGRHLKNAPGDREEPEIEIASEQELFATRTGQVVTSFRGETVHSLNLRHAESLAAQWPAPGSAGYREHVVRALREMSGYSKPQPGPSYPYGVIERDGYRIEKLVIDSEPGILLPGLLYVPASPAGRKPAVVAIDSRGKSAGRAQWEAFVRTGFVVLAVDARGFGETRTEIARGGPFEMYFGDYNTTMTAILLGKTMVGLRARDIARAVDVLAAHPEVDTARISGFGKLAGAPPMLAAAALDERIHAVSLENGLAAYMDVVRSPVHMQIFESVIPGALKSFDLPDVAGALAPRPVHILDPLDPLGRPLAPARALETYRRTAAAYQTAAGAFRVAALRPEEDAAPRHVAFLSAVR
ncbi:MAG: acetylxylan esterase [Bryobacterales bacterium]|nr:acetylxylan esterase [Bryobacterales bacterium]